MFSRLVGWIEKKKFLRNLSNQKLIISKLFKLEKILGYPIQKVNLYTKAITHTSFLDIEPNLQKDNERLEFLGDSVLDLIVAKFLFDNYMDKDEGYLTKIRSHIVDKDALAEAAKMIFLNEVVLYNKKFIKGSSEGLNKILADSVESLIAAIYLDKGYNITEKLVLKWLIDPNIKTGNLFKEKNFKGRLLEFTHSHSLMLPEYFLENEEGPDHNKIFTISVLIDGKFLASAKGKSKKSAEQEAAKIALQILEKQFQ